MWSRRIALARRAFHIAAPRRREVFDPATVERISEDVDVCIVGAGPAGLSAAIRLKQLEKEKGKEFRVVVLEKGGEVGASKSCRVTCTVSMTRRRIPYPFRRGHRTSRSQRIASGLALEG